MKRHHGLLAAALAFATLPARAAEFEKYLIDDANAVLTVNVKQAVASPVFTKQFRKQAEDLLKMGPVPGLLKDTGFDPLKDIERFTLVFGRSCYAPEGELKEGAPFPESTPVVIVQGNLDATKVKVLADHAAKELGLVMKDVKIGNGNAWELAGKNVSFYVVMPEKGTVVISSVKEHVSDALDKAAGKKKPQLTSKAMQDLIAKMDSEATASWAATGDMINGTTVTKKTSKDDPRPRIVKHYTLAQDGIATVIGSVTAADDFKAETTLTCKDGTTAKELADAIDNRLKQDIAKMTKAAAEKKGIAALIDAVKSVKLTTKDQTILLTAQAKADAVESFIRLVMAPAAR
jgi:hypothetical protein